MKNFIAPDYVKRFLLLSARLPFNPDNGLEQITLYFLNSPRRVVIEEVGAELMNDLFAPDPNYTQDQCLPISYLFAQIYRLRKDLQGAFDLNSFAGRFSYVSWILQFGMSEVFSPAPFVAKPPYERAFAVNLVGFAQKEFGIGEVLSLTAKALDRTNIPYHIVDVDKTELQLRYPLTIFCLPGMEIYKLLFKFGKGLFAHTYNVGYSPWELTKWPSQLDFCFDDMREVWGLSDFNSSVLQKSLGDKPAYPVQLGIDRVVPSPRIFDFLDSNLFSFLSIFDFNSSVHRKNPRFTLETFQEAFKGESGVRLIFKTQNYSAQNPIHKEIRDSIEKDPRVHIVDGTWTRQDIAALMKSCQCVVSLHKSEGFGLVIAEAMMLEVPTVATYFSGNTDFCNDQTCFLVPAEVIPVGDGEYPFAEPDCSWGSPRRPHAVAALQCVYKDESLRQKKAAAAKKMIEENFSTRAMSGRLTERIEAIGKKVGLI